MGSPIVALLIVLIGVTGVLAIGFNYWWSVIHDWLGLLAIGGAGASRAIG